MDMIQEPADPEPREPGGGTGAGAGAGAGAGEAGAGGAETNQTGVCVYLHVFGFVYKIHNACEVAFFMLGLAISTLCFYFHPP